MPNYYPLIMSQSALILGMVLTTTAVATTSIQAVDLFSRLPTPTLSSPMVENSTLSMQLTTYTAPRTMAAECWTLPQGIRPVIVGDYFLAVQQIMVMRGSMIPQTWNLGPAASVQWVKNNVHIALQVPWPPDGRVFQPIFIAHAAALIAEKCLTLPFGYLGGQVDLYPGSEQRYRVVVVSPLPMTSSKI